MFDIQNRRYTGNKFKLMDWISKLIDEYCPNCHSFFDVFAGTGSVTDYLFEKYDRFIINDFLYSELNNMYTHAPKYISKDPFVNVYLSTLKNHNDYILDMNIRLGKMNFAISSFDKLYEALLLKGDVKEAYYYGLLLNYDVNNVAMFYSLSDIERKNIEYRVADYLKEIQK